MTRWIFQYLQTTIILAGTRLGTQFVTYVGPRPTYPSTVLGHFIANSAPSWAILPNNVIVIRWTIFIGGPNKLMGTYMPPLPGPLTAWAPGQFFRRVTQKRIETLSIRTILYLREQMIHPRPASDLIHICLIHIQTQRKYFLGKINRLPILQYRRIINLI